MNGVSRRPKLGLAEGVYDGVLRIAGRSRVVKHRPGSNDHRKTPVTAVVIGASSSRSNAGVGVVLIIILIGIYMLPTIVGAVRKVVNIGSVFAINLLLGWTLVGWAVALAMALRTNPPHAYPGWQSPNSTLPPPRVPNAPPGWYEISPTEVEWWDGYRWTGGVMPKSGGTGASPSESEQPPDR